MEAASAVAASRAASAASAAQLRVKKLSNQLRAGAEKELRELKIKYDELGCGPLEAESPPTQSGNRETILGLGLGLGLGLQLSDFRYVYFPARASGPSAYSGLVHRGQAVGGQGLSRYYGV